mmetsp:Transcript_12034/g.48471  ORF Transcript_12034/g.48471 Transcript_12034/m.48471 type:complete len:253 (-) Transcript_12034:73-831(-)
MGEGEMGSDGKVELFQPLLPGSCLDLLRCRPCSLHDELRNLSVHHCSPLDGCQRSVALYVLPLTPRRMCHRLEKIRQPQDTPSLHTVTRHSLLSQRAHQHCLHCLKTLGICQMECLSHGTQSNGCSPRLLVLRDANVFHAGLEEGEKCSPRLAYHVFDERLALVRERKDEASECVAAVFCHRGRLGSTLAHCLPHHLHDLRHSLARGGHCCLLVISGVFSIVRVECCSRAEERVHETDPPTDGQLLGDPGAA